MARYSLTCVSRAMLNSLKILNLKELRLKQQEALWTFLQGKDVFCEHYNLICSLVHTREFPNYYIPSCHRKWTVNYIFSWMSITFLMHEVGGGGLRMQFELQHLIGQHALVLRPFLLKVKVLQTNGHTIMLLLLVVKVIIPLCFMDFSYWIWVVFLITVYFHVL